MKASLSLREGVLIDNDASSFDPPDKGKQGCGRKFDHDASTQSKKEQRTCGSGWIFFDRAEAPRKLWRQSQIVKSLQIAGQTIGGVVCFNVLPGPAAHFDSEQVVSD